jgi:hypothetical protein
VECVPQAIVEGIPFGDGESPAEYKIEWGRWVPKALSCPIFQVATPKLWGVRGDLEPVETNK